MQLSHDLQTNHPLLQDGLNENFRAPDLGWVGAKGDPSGLTPENFEPCSLLFSNFWVGPIEQAKAFAEALVRDFQGWLPDMVPEEAGEEFSPVISVCYWEHPGTGLALVATQSLTYDFSIRQPPESFSALERFAASMTQVAFDGNDNSSYDALNGINEVQAGDKAAMAKLIISCATEDEREGLQRFYDTEYAPTWSAPAPKM